MALDEWRQAVHPWSNEFRGKCQSYACFLDIFTKYSKFMKRMNLEWNN